LPEKNAAKRRSIVSQWLAAKTQHFRQFSSATGSSVRHGCDMQNGMDN
jgi:hypothetical protein